MSKVTIKSNDTALNFTDTLLLNGQPFNLTGCTVDFKMKGSTSFADSATVVSAADGTVSYQPGVSFPTTAGKYSQEWEVTDTNGKILTFPSDDYNQVVIIANISA